MHIHPPTFELCSFGVACPLFNYTPVVLYSNSLTPNALIQCEIRQPFNNESTAGADASVEMPKLHNIKLIIPASFYTHIDYNLFLWLKVWPRIFYPRMKRLCSFTCSASSNHENITRNVSITLNHEYFVLRKLPAIRYNAQLFKKKGIINILCCSHSLSS